MFTVLDVESLEGRRKPIARAVGARAVKLNRFDSQPGQEGFAHDERDSGQEELYIPLSGREACGSATRRCRSSPAGSCSCRPTRPARSSQATRA